MTEDAAKPKVENFWMTRNRRFDVDQLPHPDGYDEYIAGKPTGRFKKEIAGQIVVGTLAEIEAAIELTEAVETPAEPVAEPMGEPVGASVIAEAVPELSPPRPLHGGLKRDLQFDEKMRGIIAKFDAGASLTQPEYRYLLLFYGMAIRMTDILGQPYWLFGQDVRERHRRLVAMAEQQGFTQGLLAMYGVMVENLFDRFC